MVTKVTMTTLMMEAVSTSETSVNLDQTTRRTIPEGSHLQQVIWLVKIRLVSVSHSNKFSWRDVAVQGHALWSEGLVMCRTIAATFQ
jgi:hypothetical protein